MMASGKPTDQQTRERIEKMLRDKVSVRDAAKAMNVNPSTVQRISKNMS